MIRGDSVLVIDFGSQYSQLIAKKVKIFEIQADIIGCKDSSIKDKSDHYQAFILSGGPESAGDEDYRHLLDFLISLDKPVLGICYGMQILHQRLGGELNFGEFPEFGNTKIRKLREHPLLDGVPLEFNVWMSHNDSVVKSSPVFKVLAAGDHSCSAAAYDEKKVYTVQFHPEVDHSEWGDRIIKNFLFLVCRLNPWWKMDLVLEDRIEEIRNIVGNNKVLLALSGGLDSSVVAKLLKRACEHNLTGVFIDTGFYPDKEIKKVMDYFKGELRSSFHIIDEKEKYMNALRGVSNPEEKRRIIGKLFLNSFENFLEKTGEGKFFLAQGTIQSDLIESGKKSDSSHTIKTHHNTIAELRENITVIEPLSDLFKNEVRELGRKLDLPNFILNRYPFPGPGYAIRIMGEITEEKLALVKRADEIFMEKLMEKEMYSRFSQAFAVLTDTMSVGIKGDKRNYGYVVVLRAVETNDFMTAKAAHMDWNVLTEIGNEIINKIPGVSRVVYDITGKPPGTIEWE
ncbi:GMP synthase large subunit (glutamine-hydrolyzing) [Mycoplasma haemofelis str. Langford 1]|uniref:GMP synthase (glutamine-hydrolyzing) n=1 Tax=Mycoplasma haemofelis (strain Langford 1) TaxID=941640 RepID=E8ZK92_MYCHL|nr:glutamine-hydrolyzing GMP synthase [Mycoplasma haemofelis]CBY92058.1 GMP synthase large subunit (glutamine-hydrolyzing) [Mycoplasma haemofelis str. Langford 1]